MNLFIRLEVELFMFDNHGATLIESLLAFEIFITVIIVFVGLFSVLYQKERHIQDNYQTILEKESEYTYSQDYISIIEMVLR